MRQRKQEWVRESQNEPATKIGWRYYQSLFHLCSYQLKTPLWTATNQRIFFVFVFWPLCAGPLKQIWIKCNLRRLLFPFHSDFSIWPPAKTNHSNPPQYISCPPVVDLEIENISIFRQKQQNSRYKLKRNIFDTLKWPKLSTDHCVPLWSGCQPKGKRRRPWQKVFWGGLLQLEKEGGRGSKLKVQLKNAFALLIQKCKVKRDAFTFWEVQSERILKFDIKQGQTFCIFLFTCFGADINT